VTDDATAQDRADTLASDALDPKKFDDVARAIQQLSPQEAAHFAALLERSIKRRRIQLFGYLLSLVVVLVGMFLALAYWVTAEQGTFVGWVFLLPFVAVGIIFVVFGRWSASVK
jgi:uncharacterized membrane protein